MEFIERVSTITNQNHDAIKQTATALGQVINELDDLDQSDELSRAFRTSICEAARTCEALLITVDVLDAIGA